MGKAVAAASKATEGLADDRNIGPGKHRREVAADLGEDSAGARARRRLHEEGSKIAKEHLGRMRRAAK